MKLSSLRVLRNAFILTTSLLTLPHIAAAEEFETLSVAKLGDVDMTCGQLSEEALIMRDIVFTTQDIKDGKTRTDTGIGVAGAIGSLVVGSATGGLGLAAAGLIATQMNDSAMEEADTTQDIAAQRRSLLLGIYKAKGCIGPYEFAMVDPDAEEPLLDQIVSVEPAAGDDKPQYYSELKRRYND